MQQVIYGTLEIVEGNNGFYLYGTSMDGEEIFLACMGDGVDGFIPEDPNEHTSMLEDAYGFEATY